MCIKGSWIYSVSLCANKAAGTDVVYAPTRTGRTSMRILLCHPSPFLFLLSLSRSFSSARSVSIRYISSEFLCSPVGDINDWVCNVRNRFEYRNRSCIIAIDVGTSCEDNAIEYHGQGTFFFPRFVFMLLKKSLELRISDFIARLINVLYLSSFLIVVFYF